MGPVVYSTGVPGDGTLLIHRQDTQVGYFAGKSAHFLITFDAK